MSKPQQKLRALELRRKGYSVKEIAASLNVSKGSVSVWCEDVILTARQSLKLKEKQIFSGSVGRQIGAKKNKEKRLCAIEGHRNKGLKDIGALSNRDLFLLGIGLYWGEGVKSRSGMTALVNSDPYVIKLGKLWLEQCLSVTTDSFSPYIYISETHQKRQGEILRFWSDEIGIKNEKFKIIILKSKPKKFYENHNEYYGVLSLRVVKSTDLKYRILGLIEACKQAGN